ncbi:hypothetical protein J2S19_002449 [Metabacillus malikii]|uniref:Uncharacterized protein n=1 Tax=Metabacillus malikii TaxID=1504265 RepID=A0ABT9ZHB0_9BACI|nr:hypothetical protein [Metabacillus malikii]
MFFIELMKNISLRLKIQNRLHLDYEEHFLRMMIQNGLHRIYEEHSLRLKIQNGLHRTYEDLPFT